MHRTSLNESSHVRWHHVVEEVFEHAVCAFTLIVSITHGLSLRVPYAALRVPDLTLSLKLLLDCVDLVFQLPDLLLKFLFLFVLLALIVLENEL